MKTSGTGQPVLSCVKEGGPFAEKRKISFGSFGLGFPDGLRGRREKSDKPLIYTSFFPIQDMTNMVIYILNRIIGRIKHLT